ncbi:MAG: DnaJ domain-containing protein [Bacteroidia bacterium]|nr:DnaJ domain-containing protein [Bacteroidia bacterium]
MNYFEFYHIPVSFRVDESELKRLFYQKSRQYHPDFYTLESEEKQAEILQFSTINNKAYKVLRDFHSRMFHVLELNGLIKDEEKTELPQTFLLEMMEINEELMELQFDFDQEKKENIITQIDNYEKNNLSIIQKDLDTYQHEIVDIDALNRIKDYFLKHKYLLRLRDNLNNIK